MGTAFIPLVAKPSNGSLYDIVGLWCSIDQQYPLLRFVLRNVPVRYCLLIPEVGFNRYPDDDRIHNRSCRLLAHFSLPARNLGIGKRSFIQFRPEPRENISEKST